jgi:di/tripeptidase
MTEAENQRIATLTTDAVKATAGSAIKAMLAAVEAAEEKTREMRESVEQYIRDFEEGTNSLSENVTAHVSSCQTIIDSFQAHHLKILNVEPKVAEVESNLAQLRKVADNAR